MAQGRGIPDDVLREIVSDPDFQKLSEQDQDRALSRFSQEILGSVPKTENLLQRVAGAMKTTGDVLGGAMRRQLQSGPSSFEQIVGGPAQAFGQEVKREALDRAWPTQEEVLFRPASAAKEALVQATFGGNILPAGEGVNMLYKGFKKTGPGRSFEGAVKSGRDVFRPRETAMELGAGIESAGSKIKSKYSKGLQETSSKYSYDPYGLTKGKTVSFLDDLTNPSSLSEKEIFDEVLKEADFQKIDLDNLRLDESKKILDIIKEKSRIFKKDTSPSDITKLKSYQNMKNKQLGSFQEMSSIDKGFKKIDDYNELSGREASILEGGGNRIDKANQMEQLKNLDKDLYKRARNYRRANIAVKTARNPLFQGVAAAGAGIPLIGKIFGKRD